MALSPRPARLQVPTDHGSTVQYVPEVMKDPVSSALGEAMATRRA